MPQDFGGMWPSWLGRHVRDVEVASSNLAIPTMVRATEYPGFGKRFLPASGRQAGEASGAGVAGQYRLDRGPYGVGTEKLGAGSLPPGARRDPGPPPPLERRRSLRRAGALAATLAENFRQFAGRVSREVVSAGPGNDRALGLDHSAEGRGISLRSPSQVTVRYRDSNLLSRSEGKTSLPSQ